MSVPTDDETRSTPTFAPSGAAWRRGAALPREVQRAFAQVVMSAEHELQRATQKLRESLGATDEGDARSVGQLLVDKARKERDELEQRIETEVKASIARVKAPIDREIESMKQKMEKMGEKLDALRKRRG